MRILFIGSYREQNDLQTRFRTIAHELGKAAAAENHQLVVSSGDENTIDPHVLRGASDVPGLHSIVLVRDATEIKGLNELRQLPNLKIIERPHDIPWEAARILQLRECDIVVVLGGGSGTAATGFMGPPSQKPVLAIPILNKAGKELFDAFKSNYEKLELNIPRHIDDWTPNSAGEVIRAAQKLLAHNPYLSVSLRYLAIAALLVLVLIVFWFCTYLYGGQIKPPEFSLMLLLVISATIGSLLRSFIKLFEGRGTEFTFRQLLLELTVGTLIAFALMLVYLSAGLLFTGDIAAMDSASLRRAGVTTSILAIAAAFLLEESTTRLKLVLQQSLNRGKEN